MHKSTLHRFFYTETPENPKIRHKTRKKEQSPVFLKEKLQELKTMNKTYG